MRLAFSNASFLFEDPALGARLAIRDLDGFFDRQDGAFVITLGASLDRPEGEVRLDATLNGSAASDPLDAALSFAGLTPAALRESVALLMPGVSLALGPVRAGRLAGDVQARLDLRALAGPDPRLGLLNAFFRLEAGEVRLTLSGSLPETPWEKLSSDLEVPHVLLAGRATRGLESLPLDRLAVDLGHGATLEARGEAQDLATAPRISLRPVITGLATEDLIRLWPPFVAEGARTWMAENLSRGRVREAVLDIVLAGPRLAEVAPVSLAGTADVEGLTVVYRAPLPPLEDVGGRLHLALEAIRVDVAQARVQGLDGLALQGGTVVFTGLDAEDQFADIKARISGPLAQALTLIDHEPLGYAKAVGLVPAQVKGEAETEISFAFPLLKTLTFEQVSLGVKARLAGVALPRVVLGRDLGDGAF
ncbi:Putative uncharacterized protein [Pararhodospirillum photometricum DSM 122]|uniref:Uncharacterized protein n=1 Tax=Pararhodospirillum photometricum DSM 122 TaxID=1150469 RepID=H6SK81_PARPM|nr:Putative uncharacterized protein [Pararhodospirillum photometricum DSM 122]